MNKVLDFDGLTPLEYKAHRLAREKYKNLAIAAAKESQSKQLQQISKSMKTEMGKIIDKERIRI